MTGSNSLYVHYMAAVARDAADPWARDFAMSIMRQSRNPQWQPSLKQLGIMRRLAEDLFRVGDAIVVEDCHE